MNQPIGVLFVCLGNICRSPLAEGAFRHRVEQAGLSEAFFIDSAGTGHWHVGELPDGRSIEVAGRHGIDISSQRARQFVSEDLVNFHYIFAMDQSNLRNIRSLSQGQATAQTALFLDESGEATHEVPDPYYGGPDGFDQVWSLVDGASRSFLDRIRQAHGV